MYYASFGLLALVLHTIINYDLLLKDEYREILPANRLYRNYLFSLIGFYVMDVLWGYFYDKEWTMLCNIDTFLFFLSMGVSVFAWVKFVVGYLDDKKMFSTILSIGGRIILGYQVVVLLINIFYPVLFKFESDGTYVALQGRYITLILQVILFLGAAIHSLVTSLQQEGKLKFHYRTVGISSLGMSIFILLQSFYPLLPFYSVGCMIGTGLLHTFVLEDERKERQQELKELFEREKKQRIELENARRMAYTDSLTGVKNKHAYYEMEKTIDGRIQKEGFRDFGVVAFDLNGLKVINDTYGHEEGDRVIKSACRFICGIYQHSPVFRIGGDEFTVILEGHDYHHREELLEMFNAEIEKNIKHGGIIVASGCAIFQAEEDNCYQTVFERADRKMYGRKAQLKEMC
ncbi:MAG: GGDEF domain-containing protein [Acetatifactor sp.]|nr:GGDEF domain-containing protein [Acetatifactor sp.]